MTDEESIERGFVPWKGGDKAPADWDGGEVLRRDGVSECARSLLGSQWRDDNEPIDIIGYRRKQSYPANLTPERLREIAAELVDQRDEPDALSVSYDRVNFWRDKALTASKALMAELEPVDPIEAATDDLIEQWLNRGDVSTREAIHMAVKRGMELAGDSK